MDQRAPIESTQNVKLARNRQPQAWASSFTKLAVERHLGFVQRPRPRLARAAPSARRQANLVAASPGLPAVTADSSRFPRASSVGSQLPPGSCRSAAFELRGTSAAYGASEHLTPSQRQADKAAQVSSARHASREPRDKARWRPGASAPRRQK